jgi:hypothetical protein
LDSQARLQIGYKDVVKNIAHQAAAKSPYSYFLLIRNEAADFTTKWRMHRSVLFYRAG